MRKHGGPPSRQDKHVTLAAISPPGVARGCFVGGQQSGLAGCKPPPLFTRRASSCSSQGRRQGEPWGASPRPSAPTYLPGEEVLKEYRNLHHTRGLRPGNRDVNYVGEGPGGEAAMDPAGADGDEALVDDDDDDEPAEMAVCAFLANNLNTGSHRASWKPLQQGWKKKEKKDPRRIGNPPLSFGEFIRAHPQGCFVCYGRKQGFNHDHRTCPIHQADTEAYKKAHGSKKLGPAGT